MGYDLPCLRHLSRHIVVDYGVLSGAAPFTGFVKGADFLLARLRMEFAMDRKPAPLKAVRVRHPSFLGGAERLRVIVFVVGERHTAKSGCAT